MLAPTVEDGSVRAQSPADSEDVLLAPKSVTVPIPPKEESRRIDDQMSDPIREVGRHDGAGQKSEQEYSEASQRLKGVME
jgi:hypothetical protein